VAAPTRISYPRDSGSFDHAAWVKAASTPQAQHVSAESERCLAAYRAKPSLVREHANIERSTAQGGYGHRQLYELIQNGADALVDQPGGRIEVVLADHALYCANEGESIDIWGVEAILSSHVSMKRGTEIGRFGLGFKSVLGVSATPQFFSRSACFGFDAEDSARRIREVVPDAERTPILRLATTLDPVRSAEADPILRELMAWATTVVRLPRNAGDSSWLSTDIERFPAEFLLFSPHVGSLVLDDEIQARTRGLSVTRSGPSYRLTDETEQSEWKVFSTIHRPSADARADAGELSDRTELPLIWAVPMTRTRRRRGSFWAFFPTTYETTLSGILNAPWKTNEDRQNLLQGAFNEELLDAAAELVVSHLDELIDESEPGRLLDYLPGRGDEAQQWADRKLSAQVYALAEQRPSLPDQRGVLRLPSELSLHPTQATDAALRLWSEYEGRPTSWCHHSIATRDRRARAERLLGNRQWAVANLRTWLEALAEEGTPEASAAAIRVSASLVDELTPALRDEIRPARIVLSEGGQLVAALPSAVFLRGDWSAATDVTFVHPDLAASEAVVAALRSLGVGRVDAQKEFEALVSQGLFGRVDWSEFWRLARAVDQDIALRTIKRRPRNAAPIHVRTVAESFTPVEDVLLPGRVVPDDGTRDAALAVDTDFHAEDLDLLRGMGLSDGPSESGGSASESWFGDYRREMDSLYEAALRGRRGQPQAGYIKFDKRDMVGPLAPLTRLSDEGRERFTLLVLDHLEAFAPWTMAHQTRRESYPVIEVTSPVRWLVLREGIVSSSIGRVRLRDVVGRGLGDWSSILPVAMLSHTLVAALRIPNDLSNLTPKHWSDAFTRLSSMAAPPDHQLGQFYAAAAEIGQDPGLQLVCVVGDHHELIDRGSITAVASPDEFRALNTLGVPCIRCPTPTAASTLVERLGLQAASGVISTEVDAIPLAPEVPVTDEFPLLRELGVDDTVQLMRCSVVHLSTVTSNGTTSAVVDHVLRDDRFYWTDERGDAALIRALVDSLGLEADDKTLTRLIDRNRGRVREAKVAQVAAATGLPEKLVAAVGVDGLLRHLPSDLVSSVEDLQGTLTDYGIAELFVAAHGIDCLKRLNTELEAAGLQPPRTWSGSAAAVEFVRDLGVPREFAGFEQSRRSPFLAVEGPIELKPLHSFQQVVSGRMRELIEEGENKRGLLSLPTGAGKTRVAVQSLIESISAGHINGPILWVAQTDELCEQAVQTWAYVWRAVGPKSQLHISRLWGSNNADPVAGRSHVVVATLAKLGHCIDRERYQWLAEPPVVVIDEAHSSTARSYTALLNWLDLGRGRQSRPLFGLTATPFRGRSESGAAELAARYGNRRLDSGAFEGDPYPVLQEMEVLARVRHHVLGGTVIELTPGELELLKQTGRLPSSAEERLGVDSDRNAALLESITSLPEDWTVLVFATSVTHSQTLAAMLTLRGVPARSISAKTEPAARKHYVSEFRAGRLRVLTNYGVLTEGFDAPAVRAVYVARPTFSPNLYQQMVGRGLRGPLNGGKDECLIVDVADNIVQYGGDLAFRGFDYLWTE
jgi:superfamily II DNA or RNA helicase